MQHKPALFIVEWLLLVNGRSEDSVKYSEEKDELERGLHMVESNYRKSHDRLS